MHHDSEFADAMRRLSLTDTTDAGFTRRSLLRRAVGASAALTAAGIVSPWERIAAIGGAAAAGPEEIAAPSRLLVMIQLRGGNDGWNTLVPIAGDLGTTYRSYRGAVQVANPTALNVPGTATPTGFGLNPNMPYSIGQFNAGRMAIVQGVGYPNPSFSHFDGISYWMSAQIGGVPTTGWIGRWLDGLASPSPFHVVQVDSSVPLHLLGNTRRGVAVGTWESGFGTSTDRSDQLAYTTMSSFSTAASSRGAFGDLVAGTTSTAISLNQQTKPLYSAPTALPENEAERKLRLAARLLNANLGVQVVSIGQGEYDEHDSMLDDHNADLAELDAAVAAFFAELSPTLAPITTVMTFSEFGRKPWANASNGTDHGTASVAMLWGQKVVGGLHGTAPSLAGLDRYQDPVFTTDFRSLYANVLTNVLAGSPSTILGGSYPGLAVVNP